MSFLYSEINSLVYLQKKMNKKKLPKGVPEENIYNNAHLLIYLFYAISIGSVVWLLLNQN